MPRILGEYEGSGARMLGFGHASLTSCETPGLSRELGDPGQVPNLLCFSSTSVKWG